MKPAGKQRAAIDWQDVRARLSRAGAAQTDAHRLTPERAASVLAERARAIARVPPQALEAGAVIEIVRFVLGAERYAVETRFVREVLRAKEFTPLPGTPDFLLGITNLRGHIVAVLDLRRFFGIDEEKPTDLSRVIVLGEERIEFGVVADAVLEVTTLPSAELREPPGSVAGIAREYLRGVTADALVVLDGAILLKDPRLTIDLSEDTVTGSAEVKP